MQYEHGPCTKCGRSYNPSDWYKSGKSWCKYCMKAAQEAYKEKTGKPAGSSGVPEGVSAAEWESFTGKWNYWLAWPEYEAFPIREAYAQLLYMWQVGLCEMCDKPVDKRIMEWIFRVDWMPCPETLEHLHIICPDCMREKHRIQSVGSGEEWKRGGNKYYQMLMTAVRNRLGKDG